jgi:hypothetical protein
VQNNTYRQRQNGSSGNAHRNYARYLALAREATQNGDFIERRTGISTPNIIFE